MSDVARRAGVSLGTVSNALNKPDRVMPATRERIDEAIRVLGYVRNGAARSLAAGDTGTVGLLLVAMDNSFFVEIARGAEGELLKHGTNLMLANSDVSLPRQDRYLELFEEQRMSGILLAPLDASLEGARRVRRHGRPLVLVNYSAEDFCGVLVDEQHGGHLAAQHLIEQGCRRIAFVGGPLKLQALEGRREGAIRAAADGGVSMDYLPTTSVRAHEGRRIGREIAALHPPERPDGLVMGADSLAVACVQELVAAGIDVPREIAVTGYDDNHFAADAPIPITTVRQPGQEMGEAASNLLLTELLGEEGHEHRTVIVRPELIPRASSRRVDT